MKGKITSIKGAKRDGDVFCTIRMEGMVSIGEFNNMQDAMISSRLEGESYTLIEKDGEITLTLDEKGDTPG